MHPDGSAVIYNPAAGRIPQQGKTTPQPIIAASQQQPANHIHSQVSAHGCICFPPLFLQNINLHYRAFLPALIPTNSLTV